MNNEEKGNGIGYITVGAIYGVTEAEASK